MKRFTVSILVTATVLVALVAWGQSLPPVSPEDVGMSSQRLAKIDDFVERHLEAHHFAGAVTLVARHGQVVQFEAYGMQDIEAAVPMSKDSIFRFFSMTKPITSVAVMMLFEEGHFLLNDPVSKYLPEFARHGSRSREDRRNDRPRRGSSRVPADREVTIRDLLRHTSGLTYGFWGTSAGRQDLHSKREFSARIRTIEETVTKLGTIPLKHQPGTVWEYSVSTDVLGRFVEVVSGQRFDEFLEERILLPLGMEDTGFFVLPENAGRLTTVYTPNEDNTAISPQDPDRSRDYTKEPTYFSGGGGLVSTATDYLRFAQMLLNGGELDEVRILSPETIELMTSNHLGDIPIWGGVGNYGFGLGFLVYPDRGDSGSILSDGSFGWGGMAHTTFWVDPEEELIGIFLVQILPRSPIPYRDLFKPVVYQAIVD